MESIDQPNEAVQSLDSRTITHYAYDSLGRVIQETTLRYKTVEIEKETTPDQPYALEAVFVEHGESPPEGFVIMDKSHIYAKGTVYVRLPVTEVIETE